MWAKKNGEGKFRARAIILFTIILTTVFCLSAPGIVSAKKPIQFKFGYVSSPKVAGGVWGGLLEKYVNEACKGDVEAKFFPNALLGTDPEMIDKTRMGVIQGGILPVAVLGNSIPYTDALVLPFVINSWERGEKFINSPVAQEYLDGLEPYGFKGLGYGTFGVYGLECNTEARTLEEIRNLKFRVAESPILLKTFKAMGTQPMVIQFPDLYESLKQGVVDGCDLPPDVAVLVKFTEVVKYFIKTGHSFGWYMFIVNKSWYEKLPKDVKANFDEAVKKASKEHWRLAKKAEIDAFGVFKKSGVIAVDLSPEEMKKFVDATASVIDWRLGTYDEKGKKLTKKMFGIVGYK